MKHYYKEGNTVAPHYAVKKNTSINLVDLYSKKYKAPPKNS